MGFTKTCKYKNIEIKKLVGAEMAVDRWDGYVLLLSEFLELKMRSDDVKRC